MELEFRPCTISDRGDGVASWLVRSTGPGSSPGWGHCFVLGQDTSFSVPISTQAYKWATVNFNAGGNAAMD